MYMYQTVSPRERVGSGDEPIELGQWTTMDQMLKIKIFVPSWIKTLYKD